MSYDGDRNVEVKVEVKRSAFDGVDRLISGNLSGSHFSSSEWHLLFNESPLHSDRVHPPRGEPYLKPVDRSA